MSAPQGVYRARGDEERFVAIAVATDGQWEALGEALGSPAWAQAPALAHEAGRRAAQDRLDDELAAWCSSREADAAAELLVAAGVPAAVVVRQPDVLANPQLQARAFFEDLDHELIGTHPIPGMPFRFASHAQGWLRSAAPTLGQHNDEILGGELGLTPTELEKLRSDNIIGERPVGA